jgi:hypothetical protein
LLRILPALFALLTLHCSSDPQPSGADGTSPPVTDGSVPRTDGKPPRVDGGPPTEFVPAPVPTLKAKADTEGQPVYVYLFTHTEDHINHTLSEERYLKIAPEISKIAKANSDAHLVWTVMFMGADAKTVSERNSSTGVVDLLKSYAAEGVVEFGYHAHHDPTYNNRPQKTFEKTTAWSDLVEGMVEWISCVRDPLKGGCTANTGGGALAVESVFGPVQIVSGFYTFQEGANENGAGSHAALKHFPDRLLGFGFPDHGSTAAGQTYETALSALLDILSPSYDTSGGAVWIDNAIKINDGIINQGAKSLSFIKGPNEIKKQIATLDRSRYHLINGHIGTKYTYTVDGQNTSPTKWAYAHTDSPELPAQYINSPSEISQMYTTQFKALDYLVKDFMGTNPGSRFVSNNNVREMIAPTSYWTISEESLDTLCRWAILNWTDAPPNWVSDGTDFYSIRDLFVLLVKSLSSENPGSIKLSHAYGPRTDGGTSNAVTISADAIVSLANSLSENFAGGKAWTTTPENFLEASYTSGATKLNTAQLLYGMAMVYASNYAKKGLSSIEIPASKMMPETLGYLEQVGCTTCEGTSWSLKPARIRPL